MAPASHLTASTMPVLGNSDSLTVTFSMPKLLSPNVAAQTDALSKARNFICARRTSAGRFSPGHSLLISLRELQVPMCLPHGFSLCRVSLFAVTLDTS